MGFRFQAAAKGGAPATLTMMGEVGWDFGPKDVADALKEAKGQPIDVEIFSYGGDAFAGLAIYNQLKAHDAPVTTRVLGVAASAASAILMGGSKREIPENGAVMIHPTWSAAIGDADELRKVADVLDNITSAYVDVYAKATGRPTEELEPYVKAESWLFGNDAFALSLATEVTDRVEASASARMAIPADRFKAMPKELITLVAPAPAPEPEPASGPKAAVAAPPAPPAPPSPSAEPAKYTMPKPSAAPAVWVEPPAAAVAPPAPPVEPDPPAAPATVAPATEPDLGSLSIANDPAPLSMTVTPAAREEERNRQNQIRALCSKAVGRGLKTDDASALADRFCQEGATVEDVRAHVFELVTGATPQTTASALADAGAGNIGMSQSEIEDYSVLNVVRYLADKSQANLNQIGLEMEAHRAATAIPGQKPSDGGVLIPQDVLRSRINGGWGFRSARRPGFRAAGQEVGDFSKGGALVDTEYLAGSFIDEVYVRSSIMRTGMTMLTGLTENLSIGKQLSGSTTFWVGENVDVDDSELAFGLTSLAPKTLGVRVPFSRLSLKLTTPALEMLARRDMTVKMALGIDKAFLYGTGSNAQPLGLSNITGLPGATFANGTQLTYPAKQGGGSHFTGDWGEYVGLEGQIASEELDVETMVYLMNSTTRTGCKTTLRAEAAGSDYVMRDNGQINSYGTIVSNQIESNDVFFGNWADAMGGMWGAVDMVLDPYTNSAKGQVVITMFQDVDFAVRYLESFVKAS